MITTVKEYLGSKYAGFNNIVPAILIRTSDSQKDTNTLLELNPSMMFLSGKYQENPEDWTGAFPEGDEVIAVPTQDKDHQGNAVGCKIVASEKDIPKGWSNAADAKAFCCEWPDGKGGWDFIDNIKPVITADERTKAQTYLADINIDGSPTQKDEALRKVIEKMPDDTLAEELRDAAIKAMGEK